MYVLSVSLSPFFIFIFLSACFLSFALVVIVEKKHKL